MADNKVAGALIPEFLLMNESDILSGLLEAAHEKQEYRPIEIIRGGKTLIKFRVRPLGEDEFDMCRGKAAIKKINKSLGIPITVETNVARYRSWCIYTASHPDDKKAIWENKEAWRQINVVNPIELIEKILIAGEKDAIMGKLEEISGYKDEVLEDTALNS